MVWSPHLPNYSNTHKNHMKNKYIILFGIFAIVAVGLLYKGMMPTVATTVVPVESTSKITATPNTSAELSTAEATGLIQMREEEKLARDIYLTLDAMWGVKTFTNIASAEQTHTDSVQTLLARYGVTDPITQDTVGTFTSPDMQKLYDELVQRGKVSLLDALMVGATIEDLDIRDLELLKKETSRADILAVYDNLQKGSRNHMRAFVKNIKMRGGLYVPQYISESEYSSIINGAQ